MDNNQLIPGLFRKEYQKIVAVLSHLFGIKHIEIAEDIVSDTFLSATESWSISGIPDNPTAWLYTVAKNKTKNYLKRNSVFKEKVSPEIKNSASKVSEIEIDLSSKSITDSQLVMIFAVCNPVISDESQIALALNLLCGFGVQEIADAFITNKEVVYKRIKRAKEKLKEANIAIEHPSLIEVDSRLETVLATLYLLFSEGYYSSSQNITLRKDLCAEAMRLVYLLIENPATNKPAVNALMALMCFHASRFDARLNDNGEMILYEDQNETLWNQELIARGTYFLDEASVGAVLSKYHLEAGIAWWHTQKEDTVAKWESVLSLYNQLLILEYSPIAALNRTYALAKANGKKQAIAEAEKLKLTNYHFYYSLLGNLYIGIDNNRAIANYEAALKLAVSAGDKAVIARNIEKLR